LSQSTDPVSSTNGNPANSTSPSSNAGPTLLIDRCAASPAITLATNALRSNSSTMFRTGGRSAEGAVSRMAARGAAKTAYQTLLTTNTATAATTIDRKTFTVVLQLFEVTLTKRGRSYGDVFDRLGQSFL
jgi:hypothetical protein